MQLKKAMLPLGTAAVLLIVIALVACNDINNGEDSDWNDWSVDGTSGGGANQTSSGQGCPVTGSPTWSNFGECFVTAYCTGCHGNPPSGGAPYALTTYDQVSAHAAAVKTEVETGGMPPAGAMPSDAERQELVAWVDAGAPQ